MGALRHAVWLGWFIISKGAAGAFAFVSKERFFIILGVKAGIGSV